jgi:oxaloacetate decarboxylase (Na+ extruding) subunit alpha
MPAVQVEAMLAAGPAERHYDPAIPPLMSLIRTLTARKDIWQISLEKAGFRLELRSHSPEMASTNQ